MTLAVLDTETTGFEPGSVVELASVDLLWDWKSSLVKPTCPIEFQAMAAHHITEEMVANSPSLEEVIRQQELYLCDYLVAHNAKFDSKFLPTLADKKWIDTWRCALHLWPDAPSHSNQVLRYFLKLDMTGLPAIAGQSAHRALYDAWTTAKLFERMVDEVQHVFGTEHPGATCTVEQAIAELFRMTSVPVILRKVRFGKHEGQLWSEVPFSYLQWIIKQKDFDEDTMHTARHYLTR